MTLYVFYMDGMASAVSSLADHAMQLAGSVSDLSEKGNLTNETVEQLVDKAQSGQRDMETVLSSMHGIVEFMTEMNNEVAAVGASAKCHACFASHTAFSPPFPYF